MKRKLILLSLTMVGYLVATFLPEIIDWILLGICIFLIILIEVMKRKEKK